MSLLAAAASCGVITTASPVIQPATSPASSRVLEPIDLHYEIYLARLDIHTSITPDGTLRSVRTQGKSYGPNDQAQGRTEVRQGQLNPQQMTELAQLFTGWASLRDHYGGVADGPEFKIRYGKKTVSGGSEAPKQVLNIFQKIDELTRSVPVSSSQPATLPAK